MENSSTLREYLEARVGNTKTIDPSWVPPRSIMESFAFRDNVNQEAVNGLIKDYWCSRGYDFSLLHAGFSSTSSLARKDKEIIIISTCYCPKHSFHVDINYRQ